MQGFVLRISFQQGATPAKLPTNYCFSYRDKQPTP